MAGIDNAPGVTSTRLEPLPAAEPNSRPRTEEYAARAAARAGLGAGASSAGDSDADDESVSQAHDRVSGTFHRGESESAKRAGAATAVAFGADSALSEPHNAYFIATNDPSQAYRRHLTFKNNGITPGKILAARRKENALRRAAAQAVAPLEGTSTSSK